MFVMDKITNVQFARIIFIAPQFVTGQVETTVMILQHETKNEKLKNIAFFRKKVYSFILCLCLTLGL